MKKIEARTLEDAYKKASTEYGCSITELSYEIIQHPSTGFIGFFAKNAIIVVAPKQNNTANNTHTHKEKLAPIQKPESKKVESKQVESRDEKPPKSNQPNKELKKAKPTEDTTNTTQDIAAKESSPTEKIEDSVLDSFFDDDTKESEAPADTVTDESNYELQSTIESELKSLIKLSCFEIDIVEADVIGDTAYIFMDGDDAALLIGKEGYRYNALSYLISNWLQNRYQLYLKLEIAQFLSTQEEMIRSYMEPVIEHVNKEGWAKTRPLDGVLVQIALEQLRAEFPNKYVAIKRTKNSERYVLINEFNKR